jgi:hypothetical protein
MCQRFFLLSMRSWTLDETLFGVRSLARALHLPIDL